MIEKCLQGVNSEWNKKPLSTIDTIDRSGQGWASVVFEKTPHDMTFYIKKQDKMITSEEV